ncbi:diacylglycerol/polyprenol kinase family protein [Methanobacterium sp. SMA-27]|uniref:diacylglycerol/polyprenol kinase family protein n=1 Tax=Methanobacterium sp. SMA-27 TaxID=1495336 RepID=UPI00064E8EF2|nr:diacylglycerol/polyprenol kinase family protein [Methanobacterium sp. SMA-27]
MISNDIIGLILVYGYIAILLIISERFLKKYPTFSRKFLHIMVGNVIFILPLFTSQFIITFLAAAPFIFLTFLMSPYSPIKLNDQISSSGHGLGLVYYSISWTILAFFFFNQPWIIAVGIVAMSYGEGMAALVGENFGKHKYKIFGDRKSFEGSIAMFLVLIAMLEIVLVYYNVSISTMAIIPVVALVATIFEGITPKGFDNITACFSAVGTYLLLTLIGF